jgi:hypothetical protein
MNASNTIMMLLWRFNHLKVKIIGLVCGGRIVVVGTMINITPIIWISCRMYGTRHAAGYVTIQKWFEIIYLR